MSNILSIAHSIIGHLTDNEILTLYDLARDTGGGTIVEIGTYQGRSTVVMALGLKETGHGILYAIDPHAPFIDDITYGAEDGEIMLLNARKYGVSSYIEPIFEYSFNAVKEWDGPINLLWIDGAHDYENVKRDFEQWSPFVTGLVAFHDASGNWPGVTQALAEIVAVGEWQIIQRVDAIAVLERV